MKRTAGHARLSIGSPENLTYLFLYDFSKQEGGWLLDGCGNSGPLLGAEAAIKQINQISGQSEGIIQVAVGGDWIANSPPTKNAEVRVQGVRQTYSAITNEHGVVEIHVPAGVYSVIVNGGNNSRFVPFDLTYDDPDKIVIENGGCAQIQFVKSANKQ